MARIWIIALLLVAVGLPLLGLVLFLATGS
jgi:hypothetical protein